MAISFPLARGDFADLLPIAGFKWVLEEYVEVSGTAQGEVITNEIAPRKWRAELELAPMPLAQAADLQALVEAIGPSGTFMLHNALRPAPRRDPTGAGVAGASPALNTLGGNNRSLRVGGLPAGYVLSRGDMLAFDYGGGRRALHRVAETVAASGAGLTPLFEVRPFLRPGYATGAAVTLIRAAAKMMVVPGSFDPGTGRPMIQAGMGFQAIEVR